MHPGNIAHTDNQAHHGQTPAPIAYDCFINDCDAAEGGDEDELEKAGRCKIKVEFIQDKLRCHITFSRLKAGEFNPVLL